MTTRWWIDQTGDTKFSTTPSPLVYLTTSNTWVGLTALISSWNPMRYLANHWSGTRRWPFILYSCPCSTASISIKGMVVEKQFLGSNAKSLQPFCLKMEMVLTLTSPERRILWGLLSVTLSLQFLKLDRSESSRRDAECATRKEFKRTVATIVPAVQGILAYPIIIALNCTTQNSITGLEIILW